MLLACFCVTLSLLAFHQWPCDKSGCTKMGPRGRLCISKTLQEEERLYEHTGISYRLKDDDNRRPLNLADIDRRIPSTLRVAT